MTLTRESKQSLAFALREARALRHNYIGTEHLLLGLLSAAGRNPRGEFAPIRSASWASIRLRPGSACSTNCGAPRPEPMAGGSRRYLLLR